MKLNQLKETWQRLSEIDPMWAILSDREKLGNRWAVDEFLATGEKEIDELLKEVRRLNLDVAGPALDFGCGIGRLTNALAKHFDRVSGVDISDHMITLARSIKTPVSFHIEWFLNETDDLRIFDDSTFSFINSFIVLQHIRPQYSLSYIREFLRIARPGAVIVFQLPARRSIFRLSADFATEGLLKYAPRLAVDCYRKIKRPKTSWSTIRKLPRITMEMHGIPRDTVINVVEKNNGKVVEIRDVGNCGWGWPNLQYFITKEANDLIKVGA